jgi:phospholipid transport system substrate-binding protein
MTRLLPLLLLVVTTFSIAGPAGAAGERPRDLVEGLNAGLLAIMQQAESLGFEGRVEAFAELLDKTYHLRVMSRVAVGGYWRKLSEADRGRLVDAFTRMTHATYARRFTGYSGERFEIVDEAPTIKNLVLVRTRLVKTDGEVVKLNYLTKQYEAGWRIVDVYLAAKYSELARLRAEFTSVLKRDGFDVLIAKIEDRTKAAAEAKE